MPEFNPEKHYYGSICKRGHGAELGFSMRFIHSRYCVDCSRERNRGDVESRKRYYEKNREKILEKHRKYREKNREKIQEYRDQQNVYARYNKTWKFKKWLRENSDD